MPDPVDLSDLMAPPAAAPASVDLSDLMTAPKAAPTTVDELVVNGKRTPSMLDRIGAVGRKMTREVFPTATGAAGAVVGGELGALGGPFAPITVPLGALVGGLAGGWAGSKAQHGALQMAPKAAQALGQTDPQIASDERTYPLSTAAAGFVPALVGGGALQKALTPAESAAARLLTPPPSTAATINATRAAADRQGVALPATLTSPTGYRVSRTLPSVIGSHAIEAAEAKAPQAVGDRLSQLADVYGLPTERGAAGEKVQDSAIRWSEAMRHKGGDLIDQAETWAGDTVIPPTQGLSYIDQQLAEAEQNPQANRALIQTLSKWKGDLTSEDNPLTLKSLRNLRSSIYNTTPEPGGLAPSVKSRLAGGFWTGLSTDIRNGLSDAAADNTDTGVIGDPNAAKALDAFDQGNAVWAKRQSTIKSTLSKVLGDTVDTDLHDPSQPLYTAQQTPEKAMDAVTSMTVNDRRGFQKLMGTLDPEAQNTVRASVIATLGRNEDGTFNAGKFLNTMQTIPDRTKVTLFGKDNLAAMDDLHTIVKNIGQAEPRTHGYGALVLEAAIPGLLGLSHGAAAGAGGFASGIAAVAGVNTVASHILAQPNSLRWVARLAAASSKGTEAFGTAVDALGKAANTKASLGPLYDTIQQVRRGTAPQAAQDKPSAAPAFDPSALSDEDLHALTGSAEAPGGPQGGVHEGATLDPTAYGEKPVEELIPRVAHVESQGDPLAVSPKGAEGVMQVMPDTQVKPGFGVTPAQDSSSDEKARVGVDYLQAMLKRYPHQALGLMAYNWGAGNVDKWIAGGMKGGVPKETRDYVQKILGN